MKYLLNLSILFSSLFLISCGGNTVNSGDEFQQVELPDGSIVYLNKESSVSYDGSFETRTIELTGEAFFSVESGEVPFKVITENGEVEVLGTEFNIRSRGDEMEVEVEDGEVEFKSQGENHGLKRGQSGIFIRGNKIKIGKAKFKFKLWIGDMEIEFKTHGKPMKHAPKHMNKYMKEMEKDYKKSNHDLKKNDNKSPNKILKDLNKGSDKQQKGARKDAVKAKKGN